ncbi:MAG: hypothetical protein CVU47_03440 [Chloroflexi bacterium HGW-Chloroflexi-9]|nr:MAG: hypothetical protein CVU47_03440 [Chloroflexi bacterium HGW-Chloroflexi-9]
MIPRAAALALALTLALGLVGTASAAPESTAASACRRMAQADDPAASLVARCRAWLDSQTPRTAPPNEVCRRVASSENPLPDLVERCRHWFAAPDGTTGTAEACRRLLEQGSGAPTTLIERCREVLGDGRERSGPNAPGRAPVRTSARAAGGV